MSNPIPKPHRRSPAYTILRWTARIGSLASIGVVLMFLFGEEAVSGENPITWRVAGSFVFFPVGVVLGCMLGWWKERIGGALTVGSLAGFYFWNTAVSGRFPGGPYFLLLAFPGFLYLGAAYLGRPR